MGQKEISRSEWLKARATIQQRQDTARKRLAALNRTSVLSEHVGNAAGLRERWAGLTLTRQQQIVAAVIDHLIISPASVRGSRKFDDSRIAVLWRA